MDLLKVLILSLVQGATAYLPVSGAAQVPWWSGWNQPAHVFDVGLHLGTLLAVLVYFWRDWPTFWRAGLRARITRSIQDPDTRLLFLIAMGTLPTAILGVLLDNLFGPAFSSLYLAAGLLLIPVVLLTVGKRAHPANRKSSVIQPLDALLIPAAAISPGVSRSGVFTAAGMGQKQPYPAAIRLSFWPGVPIPGEAGAEQTLVIPIGGVPVHPLIAGPMMIGWWTAVGFACVGRLRRLKQGARRVGFMSDCARFGTLSLLVALLR
ncbi:MAG: undecaprenyl-diphosphate phosphatase [Chloroflexi bacterium]|nr:undecaprenyl-diphosphate phosphatase [Chloroflexota bacterium]